MKKGSTIFLRIVVVVMGLAVLALCVYGLPTVIPEAGFYRPILIGLYIPAIPFFIALFETLKLLNYIDTNKAFSDLSTKSLKKIKYCATIIGVIFIAGLPYIFHVADLDDAPGVVLIGSVIAGASIVIAVFAAVLQKLLQNAVDMKKENDLVV